MIKNYKYIFLSIFLCNTLFVFSQKDTLNLIQKLDEIKIISSTQKKEAYKILKEAKKRLKVNYPFQNGINYLAKSFFFSIKDSTEVTFLIHYHKLMNSTIKVLSTTSQQNIKINYLFQIIYANLKWAKKSKGKIMNFTEDLHFYFIETGSKYQVNYFQIQKKDFSFKKIIVSKRKKGEKILRCENGKLEVNFNKETKFYHPKNLTLKCYTDDDTFLYKHQISFLKTLPFKKLNKNSENVYRILKLYTNGLAETP